MDDKQKARIKLFIAKKAYELGYGYERTYKGCGQCTIAALQDTFQVGDSGLYQAATSIAGGAGLVSDAGCSAYIGGVLFLGSMKGRARCDMIDVRQVRFETHALARELHDRFVQAYGSIVCRDLHSKLFGRYFYLPDQDEFAKFHEMGAHDRVCPDVVGKACSWVAEIVVEAKILSDEKLLSLREAA